MGKITSQISEFVQNYTVLGHYDLNHDILRENFEFYKNSSDFKEVDMILCAFTASMCEAFIPLNKTIIFNPANRYNIGRCTDNSWLRLNENYYKLKKRNKLIVSSMSRYDGEYQAHFTGLRGYRIYAYGKLFLLLKTMIYDIYLFDFNLKGGFYARYIKYNPTRSEILIGPITHFGPHGLKLIEDLQKYSNETKSNLTFTKVRTIYDRFRLDQLANHPAIVVFPYAIMSYSIIDFYISKLPIFVPSIKFLTKWKNLNERKISIVCLRGPNDIRPHETSIHNNLSPNSDDDEPYKYWLQYADYYQWPFVTIFDDWEDLIKKLKTLNLKEISKNMEKFNDYRETDLLDNWCKIIKKLPDVQNIPENYHDGFNYFNMSI